MVLEVLHRLFVGFGGMPAGEGSEIAALSSLGIFLARVQTVLAGLEFANHGQSSVVRDASLWRLTPAEGGRCSRNLRPDGDATTYWPF